uniref:thioredoxin-dependent peroxiredoxin n=1 Tax=Candidatus Aschnera chinzeii TaxID=1485666 RepID=A0AAT9G4B4_9ENTR|nr:MAG: thioredoxin-dependent thiol peroxidase [Candidatus Aschnera chinzeii]
MQLLKIGDQVPNFSLPDHDNELIHLSDYFNQWILIYFYPKAMTPGCTIQACGIRDKMQEFKKFGIEIFGISTDKPEKLSRFYEKEMLNFTLLSDQDHKVAEQFGVWGKKQFMGKHFNGINRVSFLINKEGKIEYIFNKFKTSEHHLIVLNYMNNLC